MGYRGMLTGTVGAVAFVLMIGAPLTADAQRGPDAPLYTPEPGDRDLKSTLFNWTWHMGMLRGIDETS